MAGRAHVHRSHVCVAREFRLKASRFRIALQLQVKGDRLQSLAESKSLCAVKMNAHPFASGEEDAGRRCAFWGGGDLDQ